MREDLRRYLGADVQLCGKIPQSLAATFLEGESNGRGGLTALAEAGFTPGTRIGNAFKSYKQAKELETLAHKSSNPIIQAQFLKARQLRIEHGNRLLDTDCDPC